HYCQHGKSRPDNGYRTLRISLYGGYAASGNGAGGPQNTAACQDPGFRGPLRMGCLRSMLASDRGGYRREVGGLVEAEAHGSSSHVPGWLHKMAHRQFLIRKFDTNPASGSGHAI